MIKKQYYLGEPGYFQNFYEAGIPRIDLEKSLQHYNATLGKSKNSNYKFNVKWHDSKMYAIFVMRWS